MSSLIINYMLNSTGSLKIDLMVPRFQQNTQQLFTVSGELSKSRSDWLYAQGTGQN